MKRNLLLFFLCFSVFFACRGINKPDKIDENDISLKREGSKLHTIKVSRSENLGL